MNNYKMFAEERKQAILDLVNQNVNVTVKGLCEEFDVSPATIRNDLRDLEEENLLKRTHGGAISLNRARFELNAYQKEEERVEEKRAIAELAVRKIHEGDTIALDTGSTIFELAKLLIDFQDLTVVTYDLKIALFLEQNSNANIIMAGGNVRRNFHCTTGKRALQTLENLNVDKAFLAANSVDFTRGASTPDLSSAEIKSKLVSMAEKVYLLADSSKFGKTTFVNFLSLSQVRAVFTDNLLVQEYIDTLERMDLVLHMADANA